MEDAGKAIAAGSAVMLAGTNVIPAPVAGEVPSAAWRRHVNSMLAFTS